VEEWDVSSTYPTALYEHECWLGTAPRNYLIHLPREQSHLPRIICYANTKANTKEARIPPKCNQPRITSENISPVKTEEA